MVRVSGNHTRAAVFLGVALARCAVVLLAGPDSGFAAAGGTHTSSTRYTDPAGWAVTYPRTMQLERSSGAAGPFAAYAEVTVANFAQQRAVHVIQASGGARIVVDPPLTRGGAFPPDGIAFRMLLHQGVQPPPFAQVPDSRFPILLSRFEPGQAEDFPGGNGQGHGVPSWRDLQIDADGEHYTGIVLIGPQASVQQRAELARVIASLVFAPFHSGTVVSGLAALGPASRYPVGSFTLVHVPAGNCAAGTQACRSGGTPFYLVHGPGVLQPDLIRPCPQAGACAPPGAFYAVSWTTPSQHGDYAQRCNLRFDSRADEFYCTNMHARWDRVGRVLTRPANARSGYPLQFVLARWRGTDSW
jgi:hypothetical protein